MLPDYDNDPVPEFYMRRAYFLIMNGLSEDDQDVLARKMWKKISKNTPNGVCTT